MIDVLKKMQSRIKYSRLYVNGKRRRLYIRYGENSHNIKTSAWFEIVNDNITTNVIVENIRHPNLYDKELEAIYKDEINKQLHEIINDCELERKETPLHIRLKDDILPVYDDKSLKHQADALRFCCSMKVSALYADTGTGKSKIAIDLAISRYDAGQIKKALVILPVSTKLNFEKQLNQWCHRREINWFIVGHESIGSSDNRYLEALDYVDSETQIIVDESHLIKNPIAKRSKRIKTICEKTSYKLVMTGTPVTENVHNLYMQYSVLSPLIIGVRDWKKFEEKYLIMGGRLGDEIIGHKNVDHLMGLLEPYTYQITKEECLDLPAKTFTEHTCGMSELQWNYYIEEKDRLLEVIKSEDFQATDIFKAFTRMQQICCGFITHPDEGVISLYTHKFSLFSDIPEDEPLIIFCKYLYEIDLVVEHFGTNQCAVFTGQNKKERDNELASFVDGSKKYFVATMQTGGTGLNGLQTVCRRIVFFSNSFSYFHRKQSIGRIDRQGQYKEMYIHDFRTNANIETRILSNLSRKGNLSDEIKRLMADKTELKKYIDNLYVNEKYTYICENSNNNTMKTEILQGTEKRLYELLGPLVMNAKVLRQNDNVAFKTSEKHIYVVAVDDTDTCIGFIPVQRKGGIGETNNYYIKDRDPKILTLLLKEAMKYMKKKTDYEFLNIIAQAQDYEAIRKLGFEVEKPFVKYTKFIKKI